MVGEELQRRQGVRETAFAAGMRAAKLQKWLEKDVFKLDADKGRERGEHRRYSLFDAIQFALAERLVVYGVSLSFASRLAREIVDKMMHAAEGDVDKGVQIFLNARIAINIVRSDQGDLWNYTIQGSCEFPTETYIMVNFGFLCQNVIERWKNSPLKGED
jgi:hypothetical protein